MRIKNPDLNVTCSVNHRIKNMVVRVTHAVTKGSTFRGAVIYDSRTTSAYSGIVNYSGRSSDHPDYQRILDYVKNIGPVSGASDGYYDDGDFCLSVIPYMGTDPAVLFKIDHAGHVTHVPLVIDQS